MRIRQCAFTGLFLAQALVFSPHLASAAKSTGASVDIGFFSKNDTSVLAPLFNLVVPLGTIAIEAQWGVFFIDPQQETADSEFKSLNPFVAAHYSLNLVAAELSVGAGVAVPIVDADGLSGIPLLMRGGWNAWLYRPDTLTIATPASLDFNIPAFDLRAEGALMLGVPTKDGGDTDFGFQLAGEVAIPAAVIIDLGARLQLVSPDFDEANLSIEPFAQLALGPLLARVGFLINLDSPNSFSDGGVWGLRAGLGLSL